MIINENIVLFWTFLLKDIHLDVNHIITLQKLGRILLLIMQSVFKFPWLLQILS